MSSLSVLVTDPSGQPVPNFIATIGVMDGAGQPAPMEPAIRVQQNFWSSSKTYGEMTGRPAPFTIYGTVRASGYKEAYIPDTVWDGASDLPIRVTLAPGFRVPTRAQACSIRRHFQGLYVQTAGWGTIPWFVAALNNLGPDLPGVLAQLRAAGDTHAQIDVVWSYQNDQGYTYPVPGLDLTDRLDEYVAIVDQVTAAGLIPVYAVTGEGSPDWIRANLPRLVDALGDRVRWGPFYAVYDGLWPGSWSVAQMKEMIPWMRSVITDAGYLGFMFGTNAGRPYFFVENESDYGQPWMQALDFVMMSEGSDQVQCPALVNGMQYLLGPQLTPSGPCTPQFTGPWLMKPGTPRGPYFAGVDEWDEYRWVRGQVTQSIIDADRGRLESVGIVCHG